MYLAIAYLSQVREFEWLNMGSFILMTKYYFSLDLSLLKKQIPTPTSRGSDFTNQGWVPEIFIFDKHPR